MVTYVINKVGDSGRESFAMDIKAHSLQAAWMGAKPWFIKGTFHVFQKDNRANGAVFTK